MADLSVVIPYTLQDEHLLARAVASVDMDVEIVTFLDADRRGAGWARNQGVARASCDWIVKFDADDQLEPGTLAKLWERRWRGDITSTGGAKFVTYDGDPLHTWEYEDTSARTMLTRMRTPASAGTLLYPRAVGDYPEDCGAYEGWAFVCGAVRDGFEVTTVPGTYYVHTVRDGSYWPSRQEMRLADLERAFAYVNEMYAEAVG